MKAVRNDQIDGIRNKIKNYPEMLEVFDYCLRHFTRSEVFGVALDGSLVKGTPDEYSDIDLLFFIEPVELIAAEREKIKEIIFSSGRLLAHFTASHLGLDHILVFFLEKGEKIVKIDAELLAVDDFERHPHAVILHDPMDKLEKMADKQSSHTLPQASSPLPDFNDIYQKFTGWIWYTYSKLPRGEYFEAVDSMDIMRKLALLPCIYYLENIPADGYRRLEERLPSALLSSLKKTFPVNFTHEEIWRALRELVQLFVSLQESIVKRTGQDHRQADLEGLVSLIRHMEK